MARRWETKDANGNPLTDGRLCLVIESDEPGMAPIRVYGKDKDDILDKVALTVETGQTTIHRLRKNPSTPAAPAPAARPATTVSVDEQARATAELNNPAKAPEAVKTLLKAAGVDVDQQQQDSEARKLAALCLEWERRNPDFPFDPRNQRQLVDRAILRFGKRNLTLAALDSAHEELQSQQMYFEPKAPTAPAVPPRGSEETRTVPTRLSTTYRRNALRADVPEPSQEQESAKIQRWRKILETSNSKQLKEAFASEPGFQEWANKALTKTA